MESEVLSEKVEWEARRIAVAFGFEVGELELDSGSRGERIVYHASDDIELEVFFFRTNAELCHIDLSATDLSGLEDNYCQIGKSHPESEWTISAGQGSTCDLMARGLYCLGVEDEAILSQLPTLNDHEKVQLRLSFPREFWPQKWLEEEKGLI